MYENGKDILNLKYSLAEFDSILVSVEGTS